MFIDASKDFVKDGNKNRLRQRDIRKIVDTVISRKSINHYSSLVSFKKIKDNGFNLNIPRYVDSSAKEDTHDIYALMFGGIPNSEIDSETLKPFWKQFPTLKSELFEAINDTYSSVSTENAKTIIESNVEVVSFIKKHEDNFKYLRNYLKKEFISNPEELHVSSLEMQIAKTIRDKVDEDGLIDYYDCFEALDNNWQEILPDLETYRSQGIVAAREIDEIKVLKKDTKSKKLEEKVVGVDGRLIPFAMIQKIYFIDMAKELEALENEISSLESEKDELLDSIDPEDKRELLKDGDSDDIDTKKLKAKITEIKKNIKKGAEYEDDSYEAIIIRIDETNEKISKAKKKKNTLEATLDKETEKKIRSLTDEEIHDLLVKKWVDPICDDIEGISRALISSLESQITFLAQKYDTTYTELEDQVSEAEDSLSSMLDNLTGSEFDMRGLKQFKTLLSVPVEDKGGLL